MKRLGSKVALFAVLCLVVPLLWSGEVEAQEQTLGTPDMEFTIAVGETMTFNARGVRRIVAGDETVADPQTSRDGRFIFVTGRSPGTANINIFSGDSDEPRTLLVRVVGINPISLAEEVRNVLGDGAGVDIRVVNGRVLIEGEVSSAVFQRKIDRMTELYPDQVLNFANYREAFVEGARMVALDVYFIQMATTGRDNLGVSWDQFIGFNLSGGTGDVPLYYDQGELGPGVLPGEQEAVLPRPIALTGGEGITSYSSLVGNLNFALDFMVEHGLIKTIQQATLVTEAGTEVDYLSGGTILIPVQTQTTTEVVEKDFGLELTVTPVLDFENRVKLIMQMQYREIDFSLGVGELPGLRGTSVTTTVNMREGQSVLISAQSNEDHSSTERGFWLLGQIPLLGWAFKSRSFVSEQQNNALFITPRVYEPNTDYHRTLVQGVFNDLTAVGASSDDLPELTNAD